MRKQRKQKASKDERDGFEPEAVFLLSYIDYHEGGEGEDEGVDGAARESEKKGAYDEKGNS